MPTKVRVLLRLSGGMYHGGNARRQLEQAYKYWIRPAPSRKEINGVARLKFLFDAIPNDNKAMWLFREPKGVSIEKSRFLKLVKYFRIGTPLTRRVTLRVPLTSGVRRRIAMTTEATAERPMPTISDPSSVTMPSASQIFTWNSPQSAAANVWAQTVQEEQIRWINSNLTRPPEPERPTPRPRPIPVDTDIDPFWDPERYEP